MTAQIRIGTSGWHYKHWVGAFYPNKMPASRMLEYYIREFDTVELNNSFYKLPDFKTFACWRDATPEGFEFAVKASRFTPSERIVSSSLAPAPARFGTLVEK